MRKKPKTCALLISTYNWPEALRLVLESVRRQTRVPDEVLVADDGSGEKTRRLIEDFRKDFPCPLIHIWQEDKGFRLGAIRNKAIAQCRCEYFLQIDGDCVMDPHFVEDHLALAENGWFTCGGRVLVSKERSKQALKKGWFAPRIFSRSFSNRINMMRIPALAWLCRHRLKRNNRYVAKGCNMAFWTKDVIAINGYNEDISGWGREDSELEIRLMKLGINRQVLKFGGALFHLFHNEADRSRDAKNIEILNRALASPEYRTPNGIVKDGSALR